MTGEHGIRPMTGPGILLCALAILLVGIAGCEDRLARMEENQVRLQAMVAANARQLATVSSQVHVGTGEIQEGIRTLGQNDEELAAGITAIRDEQASLNVVVENGSQTTHSRLASLDEKQQSLQEGVAEVTDVARRTAGRVTALAREQAALHETVQTARQEFGDHIAVVADSQLDIRTDITQLREVDGRIAEQLAAMSADQTSMRQTLDANHRTLAGQVAAVVENQQSLQKGLSDNRQAWTSGLQALHQETQQIAADVTSLAAGQDSVHQTLERHNESADERMTQLSHGQQQLHGQLDALTTTTGRTESAIATLNGNHAALHEAIRTGMDDLQQRTDRVDAHLDSLAGQQASLQQRIHAGDEALARRAAELADRQEALLAQLDVLMTTTSQSALDILGLHDSQTLLQQTMSAGVKDLGSKTDQMAAQVAAVTASQTSLRDTIRADHETGNAAMTNITAKADQIAADVAGVAAGQINLRSAISEGHETLSARMGTVADGQQALRTDMARVGQIAEDTAADFAQIASTQKALDQALSTHVGIMNGHVATLAENQAQLQAGLNTITATTGQTALDVIDVVARQDAVQQALQSHHQAAGSRMTALAENQERIGNGLDTLTATAGQTALDVLDIAVRQDAIARGQQDSTEALGGRMAELTGNQRHVRDRLDVVTATTGQMALDVLAVSDGQTQLAQDMRADRQELALSLAALADSQQQWMQRLDAARDNVQTLAANISTIEQRITALQGSVQESLTGLASQLGDNGRKRVEFETRVNQDIQAMADAVAQLSRIENLLKEQMQQIQSRTKSQMDDIISAIQRLSQAPAEMKVSSTGTKPESSVVEAATK